MSKFSGKFDLYDHIYMSSENYMEAFEAFKKRTNGCIYQYRQVILTKYNIEHELELAKTANKLFELKEVINKDSGKKAYSYMGKIYKTLTALNKYGYHRRFEIKFNNVVDIIPYYNYLIVMSGSSKDSEYIVISDKSYIDQLEEDYLSVGSDISGLSFYRKNLQEHYIEVVNNYLNTTGRLTTEMTEVFADASLGNKLFVKVLNPIDYNFKIRIFYPDPDQYLVKFTEPRCLTDDDYYIGKIFVGDVWPETLHVGSKVKIEYVKRG